MPAIPGLPLGGKHLISLFVPLSIAHRNCFRCNSTPLHESLHSHRHMASGISCDNRNGNVWAYFNRILFESIKLLESPGGTFGTAFGPATPSWIFLISSWTLEDCLLSPAVPYQLIRRIQLVGPVFLLIPALISQDSGILKNSAAGGIDIEEICILQLIVCWWLCGW